MSSGGGGGDRSTNASPVPAPNSNAAQSDQFLLEFVSQLEDSEQAALYNNAWTVQVRV